MQCSAFFAHTSARRWPACVMISIMTRQIQGSIVWFVATLFVVYAFCLNTAAAVFSGPIKTTLHVTDLNVSLATGAFILGFACMQIPAGYLLDKFNARFVVSSGILILAIGNVSTSFSDNLFVFSLSNFLQGIGASFSFIAAAILISQWFSAKLFPILFGLTQTISCISAGIIHYNLTIALKTYTWNEIYFFLSLFGFSLFILSLLLVKTPTNYKRGKGTSLPASLASIFKNKQILLCSIAAAFSFGVLLAYASFWYLPVQKFYSMENVQTVIVSGIIFFGIGIGTPIWGWLSNCFKSRIMVVHVTLVLGTMALLVGLYLPHFNNNSFLVTQIISFLIGFFLSGSMLFYTIVSEKSSDRTRGVAISVLNTAVFLFSTLMLFIPYVFVTSLSTEFYTYLWILPFFILLSILVIYFIKDSYST